MSASDINDLVNALSAKLGPAGSQVWQAYVHQQYIIAYQQIAWAIALAALAGAGLLFARWLFVHTDEQPDDVDWVLIGAGILVAVTSTLVAFGLGVDAVNHFVNPTYGAVQGLLGR